MKSLKKFAISVTILSGIGILISSPAHAGWDFGIVECRDNNGGTAVILLENGKLVTVEGSFCGGQ